MYAPIRGLRAAVDNVIMLDTQMTELRRVMDATPQTYNNLLQESISLSSELGNRVEDVNNALNEFARQGFDESTIMALTESATVASNISELMPEDAMNTITAGMKAFNIEAEDSISIIDKLNEVDKIVVPCVGDNASKPRICWEPFRVLDSSFMRKLIGHLKIQEIRQSAEIFLSLI